MYESFEKLEEEKKQNIINAGFLVFGENGYSKASIESIIKEANISKGSLFYYFKSKKNFFLYLYEYCGEQMKQFVDGPVGENPSYMNYSDFFERIDAVQAIKMKQSINYPYMSSYMKKAVFETAPAVRGEIQKYNQRITMERLTNFYENIDFYKFKDGINPKMVLQLIVWCSEGCANQMLLKNKMNPSAGDNIDFKEVFVVFSSYMKLLRNNFYKEEYL